MEIKMEKRKVQSKWRYFLAFLIGTLIFIDGFLLANSLSYLEFQRISEAQTTLSFQIFQDKLKYALFSEDICSENSLRKISEDLGFQGRIIDDLERKLGKNDKTVLFRKRYYTLVELEHFEFVKQINKECGDNISTILFFYSNEQKDVEDSEDVGNLLSVVYRRNPEVLIYSFDVNLDSELIDGLVKKYDVEQSLTVIINEEHRLVAPKNIEEIENLL